MGAPTRVAVDGTPLLGPRTGVGVFTAELLARLALDPEVTVTAWAATWRGRGDLPALVPSEVRVPRLPMAARPLRELWLRTDLAPLEWWTGPLDVAHGTNFVVPPTRRAARLVTVHDLTPLRFPELCTPDTRQYPALLRRALAGGAHVHTVSRYVADEVVDLLGAPPERVHVVPNGVSTAPPAGGEPAAAAAAVPDGPFVLALGTVEPRKDLPGLVAAFDRLAGHHPDLALVIAGPDGWGADTLATAVARSPHRPRIRRTGWVDGPTRAALLARAAVLAYPSRYEGFGLPPLEAMAAGVPVVATDAGALPEVLGDAAVLVPVGDPDALAGALERVLVDDAVRADLVERGRQRASGYSWDVTAAGLRDCYRRLGSRA